MKCTQPSQSFSNAWIFFFVSKKLIDDWRCKLLCKFGRKTESETNAPPTLIRSALHTMRRVPIHSSCSCGCLIIFVAVTRWILPPDPLLSLTGPHQAITSWPKLSHGCGGSGRGLAFVTHGMGTRCSLFQQVAVKGCLLEQPIVVWLVKCGVCVCVKPLPAITGEAHASQHLPTRLPLYVWLHACSRFVVVWLSWVSTNILVSDLDCTPLF